MRTRWAVCLAGLGLLAAIVACSNSDGGGPSVSDRATGLAQTAQAVLTGTAAASITPETPTPAPSATGQALPNPSATAITPAVTASPAQPFAPPSATPTPCANDDSDFVSDVNVPDGTHFAPGTAFTKTWRLRNSGQCAWTTNYSLRNVGGEVMGGATINLPNGVPPGATVDLTISLTAPTSPGKHISHWQMFNPAGAAFGTKPFVQITVP